MLLWDSGGCHHHPQDPSSTILGLRGCHYHPQDPSYATLGLRGVSSSPSGSLICYIGTQGGVIIALRIPPMLHWDSGWCHHRPQDPSSATLGLRGVSLSPSGSLICYNGHSDYPLWSVTLHQNSLREVTIYARKKMIKDILSLNYLLRRKREIREQYKKCLCLERS